MRHGQKKKPAQVLAEVQTISSGCLAWYRALPEDLVRAMVLCQARYKVNTSGAPATPPPLSSHSLMNVDSSRSLEPRLMSS
jgi:hypothetical protein